MKPRPRFSSAYMSIMNVTAAAPKAVSMARHSLTGGRSLDSAAMYLAHAGHWLTSIAYFVPVIGFLIWLAVTQIKERRKG
jgi:hypothetical protein